MHGLLFKAKRKPNKNDFMAWVKATYRRNKRTVYVVKDSLGYWVDEKNNRYTEESLDFPDTKIHH